MDDNVRLSQQFRSSQSEETGVSRAGADQVDGPPVWPCPVRPCPVRPWRLWPWRLWPWRLWPRRFWACGLAHVEPVGAASSSWPPPARTISATR